MADVHEPEVRSYNMSRIRGKDTKPEMLVRKFLFSKGFRYRLHDNKLPGKPDLVMPKYKTVIQIYGCFWHGHKGCKYFVLPKTRTKWWKEKIDRTIDRDKAAAAKLQSEGWKVIVVWECELKPNRREDTMNQLIKKITA